MASVKKKIVKNTIANTLLKFWGYIVGFLIFPFMIHYVGVEDYGVYLLVGAFVGYFGLLDFGVNTALVKYIAEFTAKKDEESINKVVNSTFIFYLLIGIVICISILILGATYIDIFNIESGDIQSARLIAYLMAIGALTSWPIRSFNSIIDGMQRYDINAIINFITININAAVTVVLLLMGYGIVEVIFWGIVTGAIGQIARVVIAQKLLPFIQLHRKYITLATLKSVFTFSSVVFIRQISLMMIYGIDRIVLGIFVSVSAITFYSIALKLHDLITEIGYLPQSSLLPATTELYAKHEKEKLNSLILKGTKYTNAIYICLSALLIPLAGPIINVWVGSEFTTMAQGTQIFVIYLFLYGLWAIPSIVLLSMEKYRLVLLFNIITATVNVILSIIFTMQFGTIGVILGTVIPYLLFLPVFIWYGLKEINVNRMAFFNEVILKTYPQAILTLISTYLLVLLFNPISLMSIGLVGGFGLLIFLISFWIIGLNIEERKSFKRNFSRIIGK